MSSICSTLSCSQESRPSMITTRRVWFWVKPSIVFAILAMSSTSFFKTCEKNNSPLEMLYVNITCVWSSVQQEAWQLTFIKPSLLSLCILLAALCSLFLWEFSTESVTCHQVRQFSNSANPTTLAMETSTAFTVWFCPSTLKTASRAIPMIKQPRMKRKITKDGMQQVFFHFFLPEGRHGHNNKLCFW